MLYPNLGRGLKLTKIKFFSLRSTQPWQANSKKVTRIARIKSKKLKIQKPDLKLVKTRAFYGKIGRNLVNVFGRQLNLFL